MTARAITAAGLSMDLAGALLLWKYGLPEKLSRDGAIYLVLEQKDDNEIAKAKRYDRWSTLALVLVSLGFFFQLVATFL